MGINGEEGGWLIVGLQGARGSSGRADGADERSRSGGGLGGASGGYALTFLLVLLCNGEKKGQEPVSGVTPGLAGPQRRSRLWG